jgi:hypothetical protein
VGGLAQPSYMPPQQQLMNGTNVMPIKRGRGRPPKIAMQIPG